MNASEFGKVAVLMGGQSAERDVSLKSGQAVLAALKRRGVNAWAIDADVNVIKHLQDGGFDWVFIALHGRGGEDGVIQGALETLGLPYTGSGVLGSALSMDKLRTKQIWLSSGLPTPEFRLIDQSSDLQKVLDELGLPLIVKPIREGSSIGMTKVTHAQDLQSAWQIAGQYDQQAIVERWITGEEYTATILGRDTLPLIRLETTRDFYDYHAKYIADDTAYHCPCGLGSEQEAELQRLALQAFDAVSAKGWGRVDIMRDKSGNSWLIEVNTVPGMTDHSLVPMAARAAGIDFDELVWRILQDSMSKMDDKG
jgi:D-alanine-D-alanine ligase